jgi:hypothetical protein
MDGASARWARLTAWAVSKRIILPSPTIIRGRIFCQRLSNLTEEF